MIPGMGNIDPKQMGKLMKQMGIQSQELNASKVTIETDSGNIIVENPSVTKITMQGQASFQISGNIRQESSIKGEDVQMVAESASVSLDAARTALEECNGDIAEAILKLQKA
ncbi:MAG: nascent polypeptide-associated complex protein [Candidatus Micrarchaeia archaeon]